MPFWEREPFHSLINEDHFEFADPGPLQSPISGFKLRRNEKLQLRLETVCGKEAVQAYHLRERQQDDNEARQKAQLRGIGGLLVDLSGVIPETVQIDESYRRDESKLREMALVFGIEALLAKENAVSTIDWLENMGRYYHWPHIVVNDEDTRFTRAYGEGTRGCYPDRHRNRAFVGKCLAQTHCRWSRIYLTSNSAKDGGGQINPGYILYRGLPDDATRRKIRTVLSYALGIYLVQLGHSTYTADWQLAFFKAIAGYSMDMRAFDLHAIPPGCSERIPTTFWISPRYRAW